MQAEPISRHFLREHPQDAARVFEQFEPAATSQYLNQHPPGDVAEMFRFLSPSVAAACFAGLDTKHSAGILREMGIERASIYLRRMKRKRRERILQAMPAVFSGMLRLVLRYPDGTVGQFMDPDVITVNQETRVQNVVDFIRSNSDRLENEIYVVDERQRLTGIVNVKDLLTSGHDETIMKIMRRPKFPIPARSNLHSVGSLAGDNYRDFYPVVDHNNNFLGILRHEILLEATRGRSPGHSEETDIAAGLFIMADVFWQTFLNLLIPGDDLRTKRGKDE